MLLTALKMGRTSRGSETFLHSAFEEKRRGQRGREGAVRVREERRQLSGSSSLSPMSLHIGEDEKLTLFASRFGFLSPLGKVPVFFGNGRKLRYWDRWSMLPLLFIFPLLMKCRPPCLQGNCQPPRQFYLQSHFTCLLSHRICVAIEAFLQHKP